jgi:AAA15 family ATPase/GTPase
MILEFTITNFKSIKEKQSFSMLPERKIKEHPEAVLKEEKYEALSTAIIYGRNASGKSNIIKAIDALQDLVINSGRFEVGSRIPYYEPFKLDSKSAEEPCEFKIDFIAKDKVRYIYQVAYTSDTIIKEALFFYPKNQIAKLFERNSENKIIYGDYYVGRKKEIESSLYKNQLFLSKVGTEKIEILVQPYLFFSKLMYVSNVHDTSYDDLLLEIYTGKIVNKKDLHFINNITKLLKAADTGIDSLSLSENKIDESSLPLDMDAEIKKKFVERYKYTLRTVRKVFQNGLPVDNIDFTLSEESTGTLRLLVIGGLIIEALEDGQTLIIDELNKSLHPKLTRALIKLFMNEKTNSKKAQLIFATHDVSLLDLELFRRDQVWFVEKEYEGNTIFYSVADVSGIRKNVPLEKWYMSGRLGGTPVVNQNELEFQF